MVKLRDSQEEINKYTHGKMGISAVPGSGKTWMLAFLTATILERGLENDNQEILIVTLVNSAVNNFYRRVNSFISEKGLLPFLGYRVRTLHGLAHDIVRERPDLVGLSDEFQIVDEREANFIRNEISQAWLQSHPNGFNDYIDPSIGEDKRKWLYSHKKNLPDFLSSIALSFIRSAKNMQLSPQNLREKLDSLPVPLPLAEVGYELYADYQRALNYRGSVDFDDLIRLAIHAIEADDLYLERLRYKWPYVFEDEAQDSSLLQEQIIRKLVGENGNWVRVGDPNQAIFETFTTANPKYLREFINNPEVKSAELPVSGRSTQSIISLANHLVEWARTQEDVKEVRDALYFPPLIELTKSGDPQPNPDDAETYIHLEHREFTPAQEIQMVANSISNWLPDNLNATVAVLVPRNTKGFDVVNELERRNIPYEDGLLQSSSTTRTSAGVIGNLLRYLSDPQSTRKLATVYKVWLRKQSGDHDKNLSKDDKRILELIRKLDRVEDYIWPTPDKDWISQLRSQNLETGLLGQMVEFRISVRRWQESIHLPIDQMVIALSQDLLSEPAELAVSHKLALFLRRINQIYPLWRLPELTEELAVIARKDRRFLGFSNEDTGFDPDLHKGKVVVSTMHKAKGLEWDRVYLMSVNNYNFPFDPTSDEYIAEKWFIRNKLNLEAEVLAQLEAVFMKDEYEWYNEGEATQRARFGYIRERLRLLYVGLTRAKKELIVTWNTGRNGTKGSAIPLVALQNYLQEHIGSSSS
jgi:DNA helicase-2/ATP-dependent DNA helicase PcrA